MTYREVMFKSMFKETDLDWKEFLETRIDITNEECRLGLMGLLVRLSNRLFALYYHRPLLRPEVGKEHFDMCCHHAKTLHAIMLHLLNPPNWERYERYKPYDREGNKVCESITYHYFDVHEEFDVRWERMKQVEVTT